MLFMRVLQQRSYKHNPSYMDGRMKEYVGTRQTKIKAVVVARWTRRLSSGKFGGGGRVGASATEGAKTGIRGVVMRLTRVTAMRILVQLALSLGASKDKTQYEDEVSDSDKATLPYSVIHCCPAHQRRACRRRTRLQLAAFHHILL